MRKMKRKDMQKKQRQQPKKQKPLVKIGTEGRLLPEKDWTIT
jgi:hypothetical protein